MKTIIQLGIQMINRIETLHSRNFIHRDIKPQNFLIGGFGNTNLLYLIDFGLAKKYLSSSTK